MVYFTSHIVVSIFLLSLNIIINRITNIICLFLFLTLYHSRYLYTDDIELKGSNVLQILYMARKYLLEELAAKCSHYLENSLQPNNVCDILKYSIQFGEEEFSKKCVTLFESNASTILESEGFINISYEALLTILKHDLLDPTQEGALIKACISWAEARKKVENKEKTLRDILGDCIYEMRFFHLTPEIFADIVGSNTILTEREKILFFLSGLTRKLTYGEQIHGLGFNTFSRCFRHDMLPGCNYSPIQRFQFVGEETISLTVTKPCSLLGVSVFSGHTGLKHDVDIELKEETDEDAVSRIQSTVTSQELGLIPFFFKEKVQLLPEKRYTLTAKPPSNRECYFLQSGNRCYTFMPPFSGNINFELRHYPAYNRNFGYSNTYVNLQYIKVFHLLGHFFLYDPTR